MDIIVPASYGNEVATPHELNALTKEMAKMISGADASCKVPYAAEGLNQVLRPLITLMGEMEVVISLTGHGKSQYIGWRIRQEARRIDSLKRAGIIPAMDRVGVLAIYLEETMEDTQFSDTGLSFHDFVDKRISLETVEDKLMQNIELPIIRIGTSSIRSTKLIDLDLVAAKVKVLVDNGWRFTMVTLDHINNLHYKSSDDQRKATEDASIQVQQIARQLKAVFVVAQQAKQEIDKLQFPGCMASQYDGMWTSKVCHIADRVIGLYRPWKHFDRYDNKKITHEGHNYTITPNLNFLRVDKSRKNNQYKTIIPCIFEPQIDSLKVHSAYFSEE